MRVVLDTNVFVSAALKDTSRPALAVRLTVRNGIILKSLATERQLFDVLARPYLSRLVSAEARGWFETLFAAAELVNIVERFTACRDPTDDKFLDLAVNGRADFIVTGDADLLVLQHFHGVPILTPAAFVQAADTV